jgi:hypothetical protein
MGKKRQDPWSPQLVCRYCSRTFEALDSDESIWRDLADLTEFRIGIYCGPECYLGDSVHFLRNDEYQIAKRRIQAYIGRFIEPFNRRTFKAPLCDADFNEHSKKLRSSEEEIQLHSE